MPQYRLSGIPKHDSDHFAKGVLHARVVVSNQSEELPLPFEATTEFLTE
jgi:hypothetical protein